MGDAIRSYCRADDIHYFIHMHSTDHSATPVVCTSIGGCLCIKGRCMTLPDNTITILPYISHTMPRAHNVPVPESDTEFIEVSAYRQKTKRGVKIKKTEVQMTQPPPTQPPKPSNRRRKGKTTAQVEADVDHTTPEKYASSSMDAYELIGDVEYNPTGHAMEESQPQARV
jgi:hypothetical protein